MKNVSVCFIYKEFGMFCLIVISEISWNMTYVKLLHIACPTKSSYLGTEPGFKLVWMCSELVYEAVFLIISFL